MCGIIAYIGSRRVTPVLLNGLRHLEYRGYDSAGIAVLDGEQLQLYREVGPVAGLDRAVPKDLGGNVGIAHTRWATHGGVTRANAHPHLDSTGRIAVVHNGIIENATELRARLEREGVEFRSETDTEVIPHLIRTFYDGRPLEALRDALRLVSGTYGVAVLFADHPDQFFVARNGSPLVIGLGEGETLVGSDPQAIVSFTRRVIFLNDGEVANITREGVVTSLLDGAIFAPAVEQLDEDWIVEDKGDFEHFMLKEIFEQSQSIHRCMRGRLVASEGNAKLGGLDLSPRDLLYYKRVEILACGTSYHAGLVGAMAIERLAHVPAAAHVASEFRYRNPVIGPDSLYFAVSQSGETADTLGAVSEVQVKGGEVFGIVNVVGSSIARTCGRGTYVHSGPELAVASTKAFTSQVSALLLFSLLMARTRHLSPHDGKAFLDALLRIPRQVESYLQDPGPLDEVASIVSRARYTLFLGRGFNYPVSLEGALKLKEVAYLPCEAYPAGEMKHGPIAMMEEGTPVVVIVQDDSVKDKTISNVRECQARGARIIAIHTQGDHEAAACGDISIAVPRTLEYLTPLLTVLPLQLLTYKAGVLLGRDIDRPRNLAKSVTVE